MDVVRAAARHAEAVAVRCPTLGAFSYGALLAASEALAAQVGRLLPAAASRRGAIDGPRLGIHAQPGPEYVVATWAAWMAGGIAVPLAVSHPPAELRYVLDDAGVSVVLSPPEAAQRLQDVCASTGATLQHVPQDLLRAGSSSSAAPAPAPAAAGMQHARHTGSSSSSVGRRSATQQDGSGALIVYTSGTTGKPKGALHTHGSLAAQVRSLVSAWQWAPSDTILHTLPLHHVHGIVNALYCAHAAGAAVNFLPQFSPAAVWEQLLSRQPTVYMAVPTMYSYLVSHFQQQMSPEQQADARAAVRGLRLAVSGSAAAPVPLLQQWRELAGQHLLERYGMTETGMLLSNPYEGERRPGFVGLPLPGVEVKVLQGPTSSSSSSSSSSAEDADGSRSRPDASGSQGELAVRGPALFREYWGRPDATAAAFDAEGFFVTGDTVSCGGQPPYFKIEGRTSVDIIKSGGYKLSALAIESVLLEHLRVSEVAVLGVPDEQLGQRVAALVVCLPAAQQLAGDGGGSSSIDTQALVGELQDLCRHELPSYAAPRQYLLLLAPLPRNAMGKVNKTQLLSAFEAQLAAGRGGSS